MADRHRQAPTRWSIQRRGGLIGLADHTRWSRVGELAASHRGCGECVHSPGRPVACRGRSATLRVSPFGCNSAIMSLDALRGRAMSSKCGYASCNSSATAMACSHRPACPKRDADDVGDERAQPKPLTGPRIRSKLHTGRPSPRQTGIDTTLSGVQRLAAT